MTLASTSSTSSLQKLLSERGRIVIDATEEDIQAFAYGDMFLENPIVFGSGSSVIEAVWNLECQYREAIDR